MGSAAAMSYVAWSRREFLGCSAACGAFFAGSALAPRSGLLPVLAPGATEGVPIADLARDAPRARWWTSTATAAPGSCGACHEPGDLAPNAKPVHAKPFVRCQLCARNCLLAEGERGLCRARIHVGGELRSLVHGRPISVHVDPIEKKPFYHFLPGSLAYSLGTSGCPLRCAFCQNWEISQAHPEDYDTPRIPAGRIARAAAERGAPVIAFTYNEPTVFAEYLLEIARAGKPLGRRSVMVSCGYMNEAPLAEMCSVLDAIKIDLKGFGADFYRDVSGAELAPVLRSIRQVGRSGRHLEIVNLVVPTLNDAPGTMIELAKWVAGEVGPDVPLHFTRFHPDYKLPNLPPTPVATLERAREIALRQGVRFVYVGNVPGHPGNHTYCPGCGAIVVEREGFVVATVRLKDGRCAGCGRKIPGVWS